jgi:Ca-activated chloride channel family protein
VFDWEFRDPWLLWLVLLAPLVYLLLTRSRQAAVQYSTLTLLEHSPSSLRARLVNLPSFLLALAIAAMAVALAGPRMPNDETRVRREGIAIVMVVDRSGSMRARDLVKDDTSLNRLEVVKKIFRQFVVGDREESHWSRGFGNGRTDDVIGLVAFARYADGLCPLTLDHGNLLNIVNDLEIVKDRNEDGTALGEGLALAVERLRQHAAKSKVAILLTDGVNNAGTITPSQSAELALTHGVKVYAVGTGTRGLAPVPVTDRFTGRVFLQPARVEIDEGTLKEIAQKTDGRYFRATDAEGLAEIYKEIDRLERTEISEVRYLQYQERYGSLVWMALMMMGGSGLLAGSIFRRLP